MTEDAAHGANPLVTVAMVTCNSQSFVRDAISSVLAQEFTDFELLVCDDHSTDRTWDLVSRFSDARIRAVRNDANIGEYRNRNRALELARGKYLMFLDGDDHLYPHGLGVMVSMLEAHPRAGFAAALPACDKFIYPVELTAREYCLCQFLGPNITARDFTQLLFRTSSLRAVGGFDPRFRSGDTHIQYSLGMRGNALLIGEGLAWWRRYPGQASEVLLRDRWGVAEVARYGREILAHPDCPLTPDEKRVARANVARPLLRAVARYACAGRLMHAARLLRSARLPVAEWRFVIARNRRPYLGEIDGRDPVRLGLSAIGRAPEAPAPPLAGPHVATRRS
jgi:glycosyltransferase involved in cell wall biosynthesis